MSKPIKLTDELLQKIQEEFLESVKNMKMFDGKINYAKSFKWEDAPDDKAEVCISPVAWAKIVMMVQQFDSEVAWHGTARRSEEKTNLFYIDDVVVYPQEVSGSTVNTDQAKYSEWLMSLDDDTFNNLRMQGHSHVNFGTTPSGIDETHQAKILDQLEDDMFYIFMIWNKKFESFFRIFDLANNTLYEKDDVVVYIGENGTDLAKFITDAKAQVRPKYQYTTGFAGAYTPKSEPTKTTPAKTGTAPAEKTKTKQKAKASIGNGWHGANAYGVDDQDDDDYYGSYQRAMLAGYYK